MEDEEEVIEEVKLTAKVNIVDDEEVIILLRRNKRRIVEDEEDVLEELKVIDEGLATIEVKATIAEKNKHANTSFYKLIEPFYQKPANKSVRISEESFRISNELLSKEYPNLTKSQGKDFIRICAAKCRGCILIYSGKKSSYILQIKKIKIQRTIRRTTWRTIRRTIRRTI